MHKAKRARLEAAGWRFGSAQDFLGLTDEEFLLIEIKLALAADLKRRRAAKGLSQSELAGLLGSSPSRVAKMEAADASVAMDLRIRGLLALGAWRRVLGTIIGREAA